MTKAFALAILGGALIGTVCASLGMPMWINIVLCLIWGWYVPELKTWLEKQ